MDYWYPKNIVRVVLLIIYVSWRAVVPPMGTPNELFLISNFRVIGMLSYARNVCTSLAVTLGCHLTDVWNTLIHLKWISFNAELLPFINYLPNWGLMEDKVFRNSFTPLSSPISLTTLLQMSFQISFDQVIPHFKKILLEKADIQNRVF